jgi:hypothetical protein
MPSIYQTAKRQARRGRHQKSALLVLLLLVAEVGNAQVRIAGIWNGVPRQTMTRGKVSPMVVSGGSITLSMAGPTSLSIDITSRMGTVSNPLNNGNPITLTASFNNVNCSPLLFDCLVNTPNLYLYAYVPSTGLTGPGNYSIAVSALEASTTTSNFSKFVTQPYGTEQPVTPPSPSFLITEKSLAWGTWSNGTASGTLYMNLNLSGVTSLPAGSYTGVLAIRAVITQ